MWISIIYNSKRKTLNHRECVLFGSQRLARPPSLKIKINLDEIVDLLIDTISRSLWDKMILFKLYEVDQQGICSEDYLEESRLGMYSMEGSFLLHQKK